MILEGQKILFIHVPKTAGDSVETLLDDKYEDKKRIGRHQSLPYFQCKYVLEGYKIFTVVRNPYSRLLSAYNHMSSLNGLKCDFYEFLKAVRHFLMDEHMRYKQQLIRAGPNSHYPVLKIKSLGIMIEPVLIMPYQFWVTKNPDKNIRFLRFENIEQEWEGYKKEVGIESKLPHRNKNPKKGSNLDYRGYYEKDSQKIIEQCYDWELEKFNYSF